MIEIDEDNIEYATFVNAARKHCFRMRDTDSGEVITIIICNSEEQAKGFVKGKGLYEA